MVRRLRIRIWLQPYRKRQEAPSQAAEKLISHRFCVAQHFSAAITALESMGFSLRGKGLIPVMMVFQQPLQALHSAKALCSEAFGPASSSL